MHMRRCDIKRGNLGKASGTESLRRTEVCLIADHLRQHAQLVFMVSAGPDYGAAAFGSKYGSAGGGGGGGGGGAVSGTWLS